MAEKPPTQPKPLEVIPERSTSFVHRRTSEEFSYIPKGLRQIASSGLKDGEIVYLKRERLHSVDSLMGNVRGFKYFFCPVKVEVVEGKVFLVVQVEGTPSAPSGHGPDLLVGERLPLDILEPNGFYRKE